MTNDGSEGPQDVGHTALMQFFWSLISGWVRRNGELYPPPTEGSTALDPGVVPCPEDEGANSKAHRSWLLSLLRTQR
jgi:hypothetical protein